MLEEDLQEPKLTLYSPRQPLREAYQWFERQKLIRPWFEAWMNSSTSHPTISFERNQLFQTYSLSSGNFAKKSLLVTRVLDHSIRFLFQQWEKCKIIYTMSKQHFVSSIRRMKSTPATSV
jgi:hypothetical protein